MKFLACLLAVIAGATLLGAAASAQNAKITVKTLDVGPGTCVEVWSLPSSQTNNIFQLRYTLDDETKAAFRATCRAQGGRPRTSRCPRSNVAIMCAPAAAASVVVWHFGYEGSPSLDQLRAACSDILEKPEALKLIGVPVPSSFTFWTACRRR